MKAADAPPSPRRQRVSSIDGIRGFLALGVFFHHVVITYPYVTRGVWSMPESHFYKMIGQVAVDIFFMITGYLFWAKAIKEKGRMDLRRLYIGRLFRIGPLYLFAVAAMLIVLAFKTNFQLKEPVSTVFLESVEWLALGFFMPQPVNAYAATNNILAGVTWTLHYEWLFYLSLALTSFFAAFKRKTLFASSAAYVLTLFFLSRTDPSQPQGTQLFSIALFLAGMICASLESNGLILVGKPYAKSLALLILLILIFGGPWLPNTVIPLLMAFAVFYLVICGTTFFGLLGTRAAHRLGNISYGIYLLQGLALTVAFSPGFIRNTVTSSPWRYWSFSLLCHFAEGGSDCGTCIC